MKLLVCNVGSTSLKYRLFDMGRGCLALASGKEERVGAPMGRFTHEDAAGKTERELPIPGYAEGIALMLDALTGNAIGALSDIACVAFKVVHAKGVTGVQPLDERVLSAMAEFNSVAPSHNPPYIAAIEQFRALMPGVPLIGSFETGFHASMPERAYLYSIPKELTERYGIRRYGFHGASHEYLSKRAAELMGTNRLRLVTCHLGGSGSLCAIENGRSIDTTLGFSLQCGIMHNNRCGDIDPYIPIYLMEQGFSLGEVKDILNKKSGLLGMSGVSNDLRDVEAAAAAGNRDARAAVDCYCYSIKKQIGAYAAALGGLDAIAFSGGIGENSPAVRAMSLSGLDLLGIAPDAAKNEAARPDCEISAPGSRVRVFVIATDEELIVAQKAAAFLAGDMGS